MTRPPLPIDRFLLRCRRDRRSGCLVYPVAGNRYAHQWVGGRSVGLHRLALELHLGAKLGLRKPMPLPPGVMALHRPGCVSKACVEGTHLRTGDASANLIDSLIAGNRPIKLNPATARKIQRAPRTRRARRRLAEQLGVTTAHVRAVQAGRYWGWLGA